jgi:pyridoxal phosphate enzyme (YggS family)
MSAIAGAAVAERLDAVRARIRAAGGSHVKIVAVTKGFGPEAIEAAVAAGCHDIGENYAQELVPKLEAVRGPSPVVHFIGRLQTNKVRVLASVVDVWQSIDRPAVIDAVARHAAPGAAVFVEVNVTDEEQKGGCAPDETEAMVDAARDAGLDVRGLMTIGRAGGPEAARPGFRLLRQLVDRFGLEECSMGMTDDLDAAVSEGSTMVRLGTALFGVRHQLEARPH